MAFTSTRKLEHYIAMVLTIMRRLTSWHRRPESIYTVSSSGDGSTAQSVSVVIGSIFPVLPIIVLYFVKPMLVRIGLILVFTALVATTLVFGLRMKPEEVLMVTATWVGMSTK